MVSVSMSKERRQKTVGAASGRTGIPGAVQARFEAVSGLSFEDVRVHYNSSRPAQLGAHAYTRGNQVYIGPGQERHLEHELGHVIQQKLGIVKADGYINGLPVNRDPRLERAADMGASRPVQGFWKRSDGAVQMMMRAGGGQAAAPVGVGGGIPAAPARTPTDLYAFGNSTEPRKARARQDFGVADEESEVGPEAPPFPKGASTFADVNRAPLTGHYHKLPRGTGLPNGLGVVADGGVVHAEGHHTIFPTIRMRVRQFNDLFTGLPWEHQGRR